jgi:hypothetical protein
VSNTLGRSVSVHRGTISAGLTLWYVGALFVVSSLLGIYQGLTGKAAEQAWISVVGLPVGLGVVFVAYVRWKQTLEIFEDGFVWKRLIGTHSVAHARIKEVKHITHRSRRGTYVEIVVELTSGKKLSIVGIENSDQAASMLTPSSMSPRSATETSWHPPDAAHAANGTGWLPPGAAK